MSLTFNAQVMPAEFGTHSFLPPPSSLILSAPAANGRISDSRAWGRGSVLRSTLLTTFPADEAVRAPSLVHLFHWKRVIAARLCGGLGETALPAARPLSVERQKQKGRMRDRNRKPETINLNGQ